MFCGKQSNSHKLDCMCHTLADSTTFTYSDLYKVYLVMQGISGGVDICNTLFSRLRQVTIMPTRIYLCIIHRKSWVGSGYTMPKIPSCGYHCDLQYIGCVNEPTFVFPVYDEYGVELNVKHLMANCYDSDNNIIKCAELATYFPPKNIDGDSYDSDSNSCDYSDDNCTGVNCTCFDGYVGD